jgi:hypothetical protein
MNSLSFHKHGMELIFRVLHGGFSSGFLEAGATAQQVHAVGAVV